VVGSDHPVQIPVDPQNSPLRKAATATGSGAARSPELPMEHSSPQPMRGRSISALYPSHSAVGKSPEAPGMQDLASPAMTESRIGQGPQGGAAPSDQAAGQRFRSYTADEADAREASSAQA